MGGINGFKDFLEAYYDPEHPEHEEVIELEKAVVPYEVDRINFLLKEHATVKRVK